MLNISRGHVNSFPQIYLPNPSDYLSLTTETRNARVFRFAARSALLRGTVVNTVTFQDPGSFREICTREFCAYNAKRTVERWVSRSRAGTEYVTLRATECTRRYNWPCHVILHHYEGASARALSSTGVLLKTIRAPPPPSIWRPEYFNRFFGTRSRNRPPTFARAKQERDERPETARDKDTDAPAQPVFAGTGLRNAGIGEKK